ncbi:hypothetical protein Taro_023963 [Colocasia esculenta]|uniref:Uncharacterized protein n=1 Tax=Colocasia esculenta TaxID=4460 RepID=A0A843UYX5_COLES|nr:hypothetical protein [Colocasia esculenta]
MTNVQTLFAKEVSTHPTMVSTQQPRFKGKKVDTASEQDDTGPCSQNSCSQIWDSVSTPPPGQIDTLRKDCNLNWMFATCQPRAMAVSTPSYLVSTHTLGQVDTTVF